MMVDDREPVDYEPIIGRLSVLGEDMALEYFWRMVGQGAPVLTVLSWMSRIWIPRPDDWDKAEIRRQHETGTNHYARRKECLGCKDTQRNLYLHHIIEVQNGGSNCVRNIVPLCFECHKFLHPWLTVEPKWPKRGVGGFHSMRDIAETVIARMKRRV